MDLRRRSAGRRLAGAGPGRLDSRAGPGPTSSLRAATDATAAAADCRQLKGLGAPGTRGPDEAAPAARGRGRGL